MNHRESLLAAIHEQVTLLPYDASWPERYLEERQRLLSLFPMTFIDIQHIGSTAVPGLEAKPIIDLIVGVDSMDVAKSLNEPLCSAGYATSAEFNQTLTDRQWFMRWANGHRTHHLHVVVHGGEVWTQHIQFRDALRSNPKIAAEYAQLKAELAVRHGSDREAYTNAKSAFILATLARAPGNIDRHAPELSSAIDHQYPD